MTTRKESMLGFTRCASTACFTQASEYVCGVPLCAEHLSEMTGYFAPPEPVPVPAPRPCECSDLKRVQPKKERERRPGEVRITSRVKLTPYQSSLDADTSMDAACVYYVTFRRSSDLVKIGTTTKATKRFKTLCSQSGDRLRLLVAEPGGTEQEGFRHSQFAHLRLEGTEYFQYTREVVEHIADLREKYPYYRDFTDAGRSFD